MNPAEAQQRAARRVDIAERKSREATIRIEEQRKSEIYEAAKMKRLRELRLARDAALAAEAAAAPPPVPKAKARKSAAKAAPAKGSTD
jgi:hypothetical protein